MVEYATEALSNRHDLFLLYHSSDTILVGPILSIGTIQQNYSPALSTETI